MIKVVSVERPYKKKSREAIQTAVVCPVHTTVLKQGMLIEGKAAGGDATTPFCHLRM